MTSKWSTDDGVVSIYAEEGFGEWLACSVRVRGDREDDELMQFFLINSEEIGGSTEFVLRDAHYRVKAPHDAEGPLPACFQRLLNAPSLRSAPCPRCGAAAGERCITTGG